MKILLTGGGTLGSVNPLLAIYEQAQKENIDWGWFWIGTKDGIEKCVVESFGIKYEWVPSTKLRRYFSWRIFVDPFLFLVAVAKSAIIIYSQKPDVVIGAGSFVSVPVIWASHLLGKKIIISQLDIRPTLSNTLTACIADKITVSFEKSLGDYNKNKTEWIGNPVRDALLFADAKLAREKFNLEENIPTILITGGSSGSSAINDWVWKNIQELVKFANIIHLTGKNKINHDIHKPRYKQIEFLGKDMAHVLSASDIVITRAGISTLTELSYLGKPSIIVPMPNTHQEENALYIQNKDAGIVLSQDGFYKFGLEKVFSLIGSGEEKMRLSSNMSQIMKKGARERMIGIIKSFMNLKDYKHAYLIGAGGISISGIAKLLMHNKIRVSGFDAVKSEIVDELISFGAKIQTANEEINLPDDIDIVIYSEAVPLDNKILKEFEKRGILSFSGSQFLGMYSEGKRLIAVSGTNGKSTTCAILGVILEEAGFDPTVIVGTKVKTWNSNIRIGKSDLLVIEADEYAGKMARYKPQIAIITNIAPDHLDYYKDLDDIISHFQLWVDSMPNDSCVILNRDDENCKKIKTGPRKRIEFGIGGDSGTRAVGITVCTPDKDWIGKNGFNIVDGLNNFGFIRILIPGICNIANSVAASCAALEAGVSRKKIAKAISKFEGTWRRFEMVGEHNGALIISDYAHHPAGIRSAIEAARGWYPFSRIIVLFQPHQRNRTKKLFDEFVQSFNGVDLLIINEIFDVEGREDPKDGIILSRELVDAIKEKTQLKNVEYSENLENSEKLLKQIIAPGDIVIIMGAGNIDKVARNLGKKS